MATEPEPIKEIEASPFYTIGYLEKAIASIAEAKTVKDRRYYIQQAQRQIARHKEARELFPDGCYR